jgi:hypothetical protein
MGTDSVKLFNKMLSDRILEMTKSKLIRYVEENLDSLKEMKKSGGFVYSVVLFELDERGGSVAEAVERLIAENYTLEHLKEELIHDFAFGVEEVHLDYWGCYAEVFTEGNPKGSLSSMKYFGYEEEMYLFLKPPQVDRMIRSLKQHLDDLQIMEKAEIERLEYFRDFCVGHPGYWVAYIFDF